MLAVNEPGLRGLLPDLTIVLDVDPVVGLARAGGAPDRIEAEGLELQRRVVAGFAALARRFPERVRLVDGFRDVDAWPRTWRRRRSRPWPTPACALGG